MDLWICTGSGVMERWNDGITPDEGNWRKNGEGLLDKWIDGFMGREREWSLGMFERWNDGGLDWWIAGPQDWGMDGFPADHEIGIEFLSASICGICGKSLRIFLVNEIVCQIGRLIHLTYRVEEFREGFDAHSELSEVVVLVRGVIAVLGQAESHHGDGRFQVFVHGDHRAD